jgi:uncharacterized surface protein with fasciclin (FAS1) repeats
VFGDGCAQLPPPGAPGSLNAIATESAASAIHTVPPMSFSGNVLSAGGNIKELDVQPAITIFVPNNDAIAHLKTTVGDDTFNALFHDPQSVNALVRYHVLGQRYDDKGLLAAGSVKPTLEGGTLRIGKVGNTLSVTDDSGNTATVVCGNIPTRNATLFIVDRLLTPRFSILRPQSPDQWNCQPSAGANKQAKLCSRTSPTHS